MEAFMRRYFLPMFALLLLLPACGRSQVPVWLDANKATADDVLDGLQGSGKDLKSFKADVKMTIDDVIMGTSTTEFGKTWFQTKPAGDSVMHIALDHKTVGKKEFPDKRDYLLRDGWLTMRDDASKKETRIQLAPAGQKVNLFQLGKGPFPLPIGQDKKDVHAQFDVKIIPHDKDDPAGTIHLQLTPKPGTQLDDTFSTIDVWVDCKTRMPARMGTFNKKQTEYKTTDLTNLKLNPEIAPGDVTLPALKPDWTTIDKPLERPAPAK
jgi:outer membrane lipoprotein-sorting protein